MKMIKKWQLALTMPALLAGWSNTAASHKHHSTYSAGEPGDPKKPAREIVVDMTEMDYSPALIKVKRVSRFASLSAISARKIMNSCWQGPRRI